MPQQSGRHKQFFSKLYPDGTRTIYVGAPKSAWQARIYEKGESVVRLEFVLRRGFLSRHGINAPEDLLLVRRFKLWDLLSVRQFSRARVERATKSWSDDDCKPVQTWDKSRHRLQRLAKILRAKTDRPVTRVPEGCDSAAVGIDASTPDLVRPEHRHKKLQQIQNQFRQFSSFFFRRSYLSGNQKTQEEKSKPSS